MAVWIALRSVSAVTRWTSPPRKAESDDEGVTEQGTPTCPVFRLGNSQSVVVAGINMVTAVASSDAVIFVDDTNRKADRQIADELSNRLSKPVFHCDRWSRVG